MLISRGIVQADAASSTQSLPEYRHRRDGWRGAHPWGADSLGSTITRALWPPRVHHSVQVPSDPGMEKGGQQSNLCPLEGPQN